MAGTVKKQADGSYRARYRDSTNKEWHRRFTLKRDADKWLTEAQAAMSDGTYVTPDIAKMTVNAWCEVWLRGYQTRRRNTVRQAEVHLARIQAKFGRARMADLRPSDVRSWMTELQREDLADSYIFALHSRLAQIYNDAIHDGVVSRSPCSRRTSPGAGAQRAYVASTEQFWALHDAMPAHMRTAVLLGGLAGLRLGEACGLRVSDVDFMRGVISPEVQFPAEPLKTKLSRSAIPIPPALALELAEQVRRWPTGEWVLSNQYGRQLAPWTLEYHLRIARAKVNVPAGFRFQDLRHYLASVLIADGGDVKVVQARLRHASARTTLDTYTHLWPQKDESARATIGALLAARADTARRKTL